MTWISTEVDVVTCDGLKAFALLIYHTAVVAVRRINIPHRFLIS